MATKKTIDSALQQTGEEVRSRLAKARDGMETRVNDGAERTRKEIRKRPLTAVGVAAGAAVVVGVVAGAAIANAAMSKKHEDMERVEDD